MSADDPRKVLQIDKGGVYVDNSIITDVQSVRAARYRITNGMASPADRDLVNRYESIMQKSLEER